MASGSHVWSGELRALTDTAEKEADAHDHEKPVRNDAVVDVVGRSGDFEDHVLVRTVTGAVKVLGMVPGESGNRSTWLPAWS